MTINFRNLVEDSNIDTQIVIKNNDLACNHVNDNEWQIEHTTDGCCAATLAIGNGRMNNGTMNNCTLIKFAPAKAASSEDSVLATQLSGIEVLKDNECPLDSGEFGGISSPWYRIK